MRQRDERSELEKKATGRMVMGSPLCKCIPNGGAGAVSVWGEPADARQGRTMRLWELVLSDNDTHSAQVSPAHGALKVSKRATRGCRKKDLSSCVHPASRGQAEAA